MEGFKILFCIILGFGYAIAGPLDSYVNRNITSDSVYRLPGNLLPVYYYFSFTMDPTQNEYSGYTFFHFDVAENVDVVNEIYLHADLDFLTINQIVLNNERSCAIANRYETDIVLIDCYNYNITGRDNIMYIDFSGKFSTEDEFGLVKTTYWNQGIEEILIESNFKPTYARRAFPCMDEPEYKASFSLDITYPAEYKVLTNTPVLFERTGPYITITEFQETPRIPAYLFSIFFSKLREVSSSSGDEYEVKVFTRPELADLNITVVASTYSSKIIEQLVNYTGVPYKNLNASASYQVALPGYYSDEMGDFGLFTYSEEELLDEGDKTAARVKQDIITNIAYKLSHEWYGGDMSIKWWSDVWANEAVAEYFKYIIPDQIEEELELANQFVVEVIQKALQYDALPIAQPLSSRESDVNVSEDIENKLDLSSYLKGASILHMLAYVLNGKENLKAALQYHWSQRQDLEDLETDGQDILLDLVVSQYKEQYYCYLETWAFSPGFPLLSAKLTDSEDDRVEITQLSQKRFIYPVEDAPSYSNDKWDIPLTATTQGEKKFNKSLDVFYTKDGDMEYFGGSNIWLLFNLQGGSFYRVNYEDQLWRRFIEYLKSDERTEMEVLSRARLIDDIFNIARIGDVSYALAFELADFLADETEYYPWYSALNAFSYLLGKLEDYDVEANLKNYILDLMDHEVFIPSGMEVNYDFKHVDLLKTVMILKWACDLGHLECITYATNKFKDFKEDQTSLKDYNFRGIIFCNGIRHSESILVDWAFLMDVYSKSLSVHERIDILNALGCANDKELLLSYLQRIISTNSGINKEESLIVFKSVLWSPLGLDTAMDFLQDNIRSIASFYKGVDVLSEMLYAVAEKLVTDEHVQWIKTIVNNTILNHHENVRSMAIALVSVNNYWKNHYQSEVKNIFAPTSTLPTTTATATGADTETATATATATSTEATPTVPGGSTGLTPTTQPSTTTDSSCDKLFSSKFISALILLIFTVL